MTAVSTAKKPQDLNLVAAYNPHMSRTMIERIDELLAEQGKTRRGAAIAAGLGADFIRNLERRSGASPRAANLRRLAQELGTTINWLQSGEGGKYATPTVQVPAAEKAVEALEPMAVAVPQAALSLANMQSAMAPDLPVFGTAAGSMEIDGHGGFEMEARVIEYVRRPPALSGVADAYAIYVEGMSMHPKHSDGELRFIHPHRRPRIGDSVIVQAKYSEADAFEAYIGDLVRRSGDRLVLGKLHPVASEVEFEMRYVRSIHRVLTVNELFSV